MRRARDRGATAIALTTAPRSPLAESADVRLIVASSVPVLTSQQFVARVAGVLMVDALVAAVAWSRYGGTPPELLDTFKPTASCSSTTRMPTDFRPEAQDWARER